MAQAAAVQHSEGGVQAAHTRTQAQSSEVGLTQYSTQS